MHSDMKRILTLFLSVLLAATAGAQAVGPLEQLKANSRKAYGNDYPYQQEPTVLTKSPSGYKPFYISLYARHGSRYYWSAQLYRDLDTLLVTARRRHQLTAEGEVFCKKFMAAKDELMTGISELTQLGWEQHQSIARTMYNRFPEVFNRGGNVLAVSSLVGRCVLSMSAFCQELVQCNPKIEVREQSSRFTLDAVVPDDRQNPNKRSFPRVKPRFEQHRDKFHYDNSLQEKIIPRIFTSTEGLPGDLKRIAPNLISFYTTLPSIGHEGMMGHIITDEEIAAQWEQSNLGSYAWVFEPHYMVIPILEDFIQKADAVISGSSDHIADLRFGHDTYIGPLTVLLGLNGADSDPEDPYEVKNIYQNWQTCKASNIQLIFYRGKKATDDILVKCLLNGCEATLPVPTTQAPYYRWNDFRDFYLKRINDVPAN